MRTPHRGGNRPEWNVSDAHFRLGVGSIAADRESELPVRLAKDDADVLSIETIARLVVVVRRIPDGGEFRIESLRADTRCALGCVLAVAHGCLSGARSGPRLDCADCPAGSSRRQRACPRARTPAARRPNRSAARAR